MQVEQTTTLSRILVPLDGSLAAEQALPRAADLSRAAGAEIVLVRVAPAAEDPEAHVRAVHEATEYLDGVSERLAGQELRVDTSVPYGDAAEWIAEEARLREADLIAMSTHGRSGLGRWIYGSVAEAVLARAPVPVLLIRTWRTEADPTPSGQAPRLLVPLDGSAFAEKALPVALRLADALGAELALTRAVYPPSPPLTQEWMVASYLAEELQVREEGARQYLSDVARRLAAKGRETEIDVRVGLPVEVVAEAAEEHNAALIVMTTRGHTGVSRLVLGSVAHAVLLESRKPLVLVRPQTDGAA